MSFSFHPAARQELDEAIDYYEGCRPGLGWQFALAVKTAVASILRRPEGWPLISRRARRCLTRRFPYGVIYAVADGHIRILAVAHCHREPGYWHCRLRSSVAEKTPPTGGGAQRSGPEPEVRH